MPGLRYNAAIPMRAINEPTCLRPTRNPARTNWSRSASSAHERELKMQLVNAAHECQIGRAHRSGLVVRAAAAYPDQFGLSRD